MSEIEHVDAGSLDERLRAARQRGRRRLVRRRAIAAACMSVILFAVALPTLVLDDHGHSSVRASNTVLASMKIPTSYATACANEPHVCLAGAHGQVPALLKHALHFPALQGKESCPATPGAPVSTYTSYFFGDALGDGPVRVAIGNRGNILRGQVQVGSTGVPGWLALETLWFAMPDYGGPFVVRGERLGRPGPIDVDGSATDPSPLVVPPGPTANTIDGIRVAPVSTWVKSPGCYAWQVDGLNFSYVIVVDITAHP